MRIKGIVFIAILIASCTSKTDNSNSKERYYELSIHDIIANEISTLEKSNGPFHKVVLSSEGKIEKQNISLNSIQNDLKTFNEFDINKPAWQKSYKKITNEHYILFESVESRLQLKSIKVFGELANPKKVVIYFLNQNNLYESSKLIEIVPNHSYSIFSVQDVNGMNPDTLFVKTFLN